MNRQNVTGMIVGACIALMGILVGFYMGYQKHEADSMRVINQWIEKEIQKQEQIKK
jgi:ABC-type dipeptide/oligopeptide/nickel transport system permease subunit